MPKPTNLIPGIVRPGGEIVVTGSAQFVAALLKLYPGRITAWRSDARQILRWRSMVDFHEYQPDQVLLLHFERACRHRLGPTVDLRTTGPNTADILRIEGEGDVFGWRVRIADGRAVVEPAP